MLRLLPVPQHNVKAAHQLQQCEHLCQCLVTMGTEYQATLLFKTHKFLIREMSALFAGLCNTPLSAEPLSPPPIFPCPPSGSHLIDQALVLFGLPTRLTAHILHQRQLPVDDGFILHLHYDHYTATNPVSGSASTSNAGESLADLSQKGSSSSSSSVAGSSSSGNVTGSSSSGRVDAGASMGSTSGTIKDAGGGLTVTLHASMLNCLPGPRFLLHGTRGSFIKYGLDPQEGKLMKGISPLTPGFGVDDNTTTTTTSSSRDGSSCVNGRLQLQLEGGVSSDGVVEMLLGCYSRFYENVAEVVRSGEVGRLAVKPEEAAAVIRVIELAKQSSKEQRSLTVEV